MMALGGYSHATIALIALALGYIACSLAKKEKGVLKTLGYIIGASIIVISSLLILVKMIWTVRIYTKFINTAPLSMPMPVLPKK